MCISAPGKVKEVKNDTAVIDYDGELREASTQLISVKEGEWVLVNAGFVIDKLDEKVAKKSLDMWKKAMENDA